MYILAIIPTLFSFVSFILSMLCIFAGSKKGYLESADLLTLNTSLLGHTALSTYKGSSGALKSVESTIQKDVNIATIDVAKVLNIHDFYSAHILNYCEGYYTPTPIANLTSTPSENVTHCSNPTSFSYFNPAGAIQAELKPGVNLANLQWPQALENGIRAVELASKVMFLVYCAGALAAGLAFLGALIGILARGRFTAIANMTICNLAFFFLLLASAISTGVINKVVSVINAHGKDLGIAAYQGTTFIGMTWAATLLVLLAGFVWLFEFFKGRREASFVE